MGGVGDELAPLLLGLLELLGQIVELAAKDRQLIVSAHLDLVGIIALPDDAHGGHDPAQPPGEGTGSDDCKEDDHQIQDDGDGQDAVLQAPDQLSLIGVIFQYVGTAGQTVVDQDGRSGPGDHDTVVIIDGDDIVAPQRLDHLRKQAGTPGIGAVLVVVEHPAGIIGDDQTGGLQIAQGVHGGPGGIGVEDLLAACGGGEEEDLVHHGGVLAPVEKLLAGPGAIDVQKQHHEKGQGDIHRRIALLIAAVAQFALLTF